jgi:hypothetical protein
VEENESWVFIREEPPLRVIEIPDASSNIMHYAYILESNEDEESVPNRSAPITQPETHSHLLHSIQPTHFHVSKPRCNP